MKEFWNKQTLVLFVVGGLASAIGIGIAVSLRTTAQQVQARYTPPVSSPRPSEAAQRILDQHLAWAESQTADLGPHLAAIHEFFEAARNRTRPLAESILGWESKWHLGSDYLTGESTHEEFLQRQFEEHLFSEAELDELVDLAIAGYLRQLQEIDSELLVRIAADLTNLPSDSLPRVVNEAELRTALQGALDESTAAARADVQAIVGIEVISWAAGESLAVAGTQLLTSAGLISAGAGSSWATMGVGILASLAADYVVTEFYNWQFAPAEKLEAVLDATLEQLETIILRDTEQGPGLERQLQEYSLERTNLRRQAIQNAVLVPAGL